MASQLLEGLTGHFPLNEPSGQANNVHNSSFPFLENGTVGALSDGPGGKGARGPFGTSGANNFEDDSQALFNVARGASTPSFTVLLWIRWATGSHASQRYICGQHQALDPGFWIRQNAGSLFGTMRNQADSANTDFGFNRSGLIQENVWTMLMFGLDVDNDVIFSKWADADEPPSVNARDTVAKTDGINDVAAAQEFTLGAVTGLGGCEADMALVSLYEGRALSEEDFDLHWNGGAGLAYPFNLGGEGSYFYFNRPQAQKRHNR
jgi:hypothetical protein